jgi:hypothetical protein
MLDDFQFRDFVVIALPEIKANLYTVVRFRGPVSDLELLQ